MPIGTVSSSPEGSGISNGSPLRTSTRVREGTVCSAVTPSRRGAHPPYGTFPTRDERSRRVEISVGAQPVDPIQAPEGKGDVDDHLPRRPPAAWEASHTRQALSRYTS